jgi:hypothetical protein
MTMISDMNPVMTISSNGNLGIGTTTGSSITVNTISASIEDVLDTWEMNRVTVDHKVTAHELLKLKDTVPTYADEIKENLTKNMSRDIIKKMTFTKRHDIDSDVHHFIGRVWVFTEDELKSLIKDAKGL